ncbi:MAG: SRPBCC family protein [Kofleriaceae bacterium]
MPENLTSKTQITIHASAAQVWKALTTPALIKQYMMGAEVESDWKVGSPLIYTGEYEGKRFEERGVIQQLEPEHLLQATHFSTSSGKPDQPENYALVTWKLHPGDTGTVVTVEQDSLTSERGVEQSNQNWTMVLKGLKQTVEGQ